MAGTGAGRVGVLMATVTTWIDGKVQTVPADDPRVAEIEAHKIRSAHVHAMRNLAKPLRAGYLRDVEAAEGIGARMLLEKAFIEDWEKRRK